MRMLLLAIAIAWMVAGVAIFVNPTGFHDHIPGLKMMGPYNEHFIRDVGLAFLASGGATAWGAYRGRPGVVIAGLAWPLLHAGFHLQVWAHRGFPLDHIFAFDMSALIVPPGLALLAILRLQKIRSLEWR
jgi:hypothetical protein